MVGAFAATARVKNCLFYHWMESNPITMQNTVIVRLFSIFPQRMKFKGIVRTMLLFISPVRLVAAVHNAWLREGHPSRPELHHSLSAYPPLYSSSLVKYFYFASPPSSQRRAHSLQRAPRAWQTSFCFQIALSPPSAELPSLSPLSFCSPRFHKKQLLDEEKKNGIGKSQTFYITQTREGI